MYALIRKIIREYKFKLANQKETKDFDLLQDAMRECMEKDWEKVQSIMEKFIESLKQFESSTEDSRINLENILEDEN